ncbi:hypothetical protein [Pseudofrankia saprophytica]|uniref:hypothetical protein n=1 Tax=Pseudofrankia saprophytica TaxID=298655 RepID=UPI000234B66B|nr:hypothetical protein [Pseudofrankia saprophytica]
MSGKFDEEFDRRVRAARERQDEAARAEHLRKAAEGPARARLKEEKARFIASLPPELSDPHAYIQARVQRVRNIAEQTAHLATAGGDAGVPIVLTKRRRRTEAILSGWVLDTSKTGTREFYPVTNGVSTDLPTINDIYRTIILSSHGMLLEHTTETRSGEGFGFHPFYAYGNRNPLPPLSLIAPEPQALVRSFRSSRPMSEQEESWFVWHIRDAFLHPTVVSTDYIEDILVEFTAQHLGR